MNVPGTRAGNMVRRKEENEDVRNGEKVDKR
jgi:hypothetical protein